MVIIAQQKADQDASQALLPAGPACWPVLLTLVYIFPETFAEFLEFFFFFSPHLPKGPSCCACRDETLRSAGYVLAGLTVSVHKPLSTH